MNNIFIAKLKRRLGRQLPGEGTQKIMMPSGSRSFNISEDKGKAGVLILLFPRKGELSTVLIKRSEYPGPHSGQVSFPGGKTELSDQSQIITALRETGEETGIKTEQITVLGTLTPLFIPVSNIDVLPVIGYADHLPDFNISKREVDYLIEVPLKDLFKDGVVAEKKITVNGITIEVPGYMIKNEFVWGATAMIMSEFLKIAANT